MLRRAVGESMKRMHDLTSDTGAMVDRRVVAKLLVTYFERGRNEEVLALMSRMLGLSGGFPTPDRSDKSSMLCWSSVTPEGSAVL